MIARFPRCFQKPCICIVDDMNQTEPRVGVFHAELRRTCHPELVNLLLFLARRDGCFLDLAIVALASIGGGSDGQTSIEGQCE